MIAFFQIDWSEIGRTWGPLGLMSVLFLIFAYVGFRFSLRLFTETLADSRRERDEAREALKTQSAEFLSSLKYRDDKFKDIADAIDRSHRRR